MVKVCDGAHVRNKAAHIAGGVDMDGVKHVLGIWIQATEGAKPQSTDRIGCVERAVTRRCPLGWEFGTCDGPNTTPQEGIFKMRLSHTLGRTSVAFDDPNLVSSGGLVPVLALAESAGRGTWSMSTFRCRLTRVRMPD